MNLRVKVLLPLAFFSILLLGYLYGYWIPRSENNLRAEFQASTERHLDSVIVSLTPLLLGRQLDTVYENLDELRNRNRDWVSIELEDAQGHSLYPLSTSLPPLPDADSDIHVMERRIGYLGMDLGRLTIRVDYAPRLAQIRKWYSELETIMFVVIMAFVLSAWFVLERLVVRPVNALSQAASALAQNRFEGTLEKSGDDEVGNLVDRFSEMRDAIRGYQTELLHRSQVLRKNERGLAEAQRMAHLGSWELDASKKNLVWSDEARRIFGFGPQQGQTFGAPQDIVIAEDRAIVSSAYDRFARHDTAYDIVYRITRPSDGEVRYIHEKCEQIFDETDHLIGSRGTVHDITELKRAEAELLRYKEQLEATVLQRTAELLQARDAAQAANNAKSVFLANMSHELRTPLNAILGFSSMMRRDPTIKNSQRDNLDIINRSGEHLLTLINDVLEVAKIEAGRLQLEIAPFDLGAMVRDVVDMMQLRAQEKGLQLLLDQTSEFPRYIKGDEGRLRQVLVNLVGNAIKFTEHGGVTIRLGVRQDIKQHLLIEVEDSGPGITPDDQKRLFQPFVQLAESSMQRGTGLGLAITRQFVQLMGGTIGVESTPGRGSVFRIDLPVELASMAEVSKPDTRPHAEITGIAPGQPAYRILIAEDQHENQLLLSRLMSDIGLEVRIAENGAECVKLFQEWHPHLIWMDRRMPVMDGIEATHRIRKLPEGQAVKIVAVTASAFKEQQQEMFDAGMDGFVRKPYRFEEIYDCLAKQLGIKYLYSAEVAEEVQTVALTPAMLRDLPRDLRAELRHVLEDLDSERIAVVIERVSGQDAQLGLALQRLADNFDYPAILRALDEIDKDTGTGT